MGRIKRIQLICHVRPPLSLSPSLILVSQPGDIDLSGQASSLHTVGSRLLGATAIQ